ncbi:MAG: prepilin-type N-terminal cleavage/methylation domain-containing protein [Anaerohalosphaeraceae bacterium]
MKFKRAFTLIELLVVIAIIALLLAIIVPALKVAKEIAGASVCMANEGQLGKCWMLYAEDNEQLIVDGDTSDEFTGYQTFDRSAVGEGSVRVHCWVGRPMGPNNQDLNDTLNDKIRGFEKGALWPYVTDPKAYHCPTDNRHTKRAVYPYNSTTANPPGLWIGGYRTYSIGKPLSKRYPDGTTTGEYQVEIIRASQFVNPSDKIIFLEETDGYGWNHRTWNMNLKSPAWVDPFAILHNDSSTFVYADGHADRHKWVNKQTRDMATAQQKGWSAVDPGTGSTEDYLWFKRSYIPGRIPNKWN